MAVVTADVSLRIPLCSLPGQAVAASFWGSLLGTEKIARQGVAAQRRGGPPISQKTGKANWDRRKGDFSGGERQESAVIPWRRTERRNHRRCRESIESRQTARTAGYWRDPQEEAFGQAPGPALNVQIFPFRGVIPFT
jgi:hypothetical protein